MVHIHCCENSLNDVYYLNECPQHVKWLQHGIQTGHSNAISGLYYLTIAAHAAAQFVEEFFIYIALPAALWPWGQLKLKQKWVPGIFPGR